jgi:histidinol-phosphate aminotransferase
MNRVRQPFNVNHLAMVAACAALGDVEFIARSRKVNAEGLLQLARGFERLGLEYIPSHGNFITVRVGPAQAVYASMLAEGVIVRPIAATACRSTCASPSGFPNRTSASSRAGARRSRTRAPA